MSSSFSAPGSHWIRPSIQEPANHLFRYYINCATHNRSTSPSQSAQVHCDVIMIDICIVQAQAALVYDAVTLVADTFNRMLKKKPDTFRTYMQRGKGGGDALANASRTLNCSRNAVWEQGDRIAKFARKVRDTLFAGLFRYSSLATFLSATAIGS